MTYQRAFTIILLLFFASLSGCKMAPPKNWKGPFPKKNPATEKSSLDMTELDDDKQAKLCLTTAQKLESQGHLREATLLYEKARQHDPENADQPHRMAVLYDLQGQASKAEKEYQRALEAEPEDMNVLNDLGFSHYRRGDFSLAEQTFRQVLEKHPQHSRARTNLAMTLAQQGRYEESFHLFAQVVGPAAAHANIAAVMAQQGDRDGAAQAARTALKMNDRLKQPAALLAHLEKE